MKSKLKEQRNAAIAKRVYELLGNDCPIMDVYAKVGQEFWLDESTVRKIYNNYGIYDNKCPKRTQSCQNKQ